MPAAIETDTNACYTAVLEFYCKRIRADQRFRLLFGDLYISIGIQFSSFDIKL